MKARFGFLLAAAVLAGALAAALVAACSAPAYQAKANEEIYGSWLAQKAAQQRLVIGTGVLENFSLVDDSKPYNACSQVITARWKDAEGSLWYKTSVTITGGLGGQKGSKWQTLNRVSPSGTMMEIMAVPVRDFDPRGYPEKLDPASESYAVYQRDSRAAFPHAVLYGDAWK